MVDVFREGRFELLALTETKLKGKGEISWFGVNGIISGVQEMKRAREGVAVYKGYISSRILWIKFKF